MKTALMNESHCINAGSLETPAEILTGLDLDGHQRVSDGRIDLGAYEFDFTGIHETAQNENLVHIVGNPVTASSYAEIELESSCNMFAKIYSLDGKLLVDKNLGNVQAGFNRIEIGEMFQTLAQGSYLLLLRGSNQQFAAKVIK